MFKIFSVTFGDGDLSRLHHGDDRGGAEEGGGQAEGPHPLTGGAVAVRDLCLIILSYVSGRGADESEKGYGK